MAAQPGDAVLHDIGFDDYGRRILVIPTQAMYPMLRNKALQAGRIARRAARQGMCEIICENTSSARYRLLRTALAARVAP